MAGKKITKIAKENSTPKKTQLKPERVGPQGRVIAGPGDQFLGRYCNVAIIHHTKLEFVLDFIWTIQDQNLLVSRIITSPEHAKRLHETLGRMIQEFEKKYGVIK